MTSNVCSFLCGAALGAAAMYFLDPQAGRRRRTLVQDKAMSYANQAEDYAEKTARDLGNRASGLAHEARKMVGA
jgi:hypothetical protein